MDLGLDLLMNPKKKTSASSDIISLNSEPQIINIGDYNEKPHIYSRSASSHGSRSIAQSTISSEEDDDDDDSFSESEAVTESEEAGSDRHNNNARHEHKQRYAMSEEEILNMKREILYQFDRLEAKGYKLPKKFSLSSNLDEMKLELERVKKDREIDKSIRVQRRVMMMAVSGVEMVTNKFDFIGVNLKGWSDKVYEDLDDYDDIFEELHDKYKGKAKMGPEEILGELAAVEEMAGVWAKYKEHFKTIEYSLLLDFVNTDQYDNARLDAYRMGLGAMNHVLEQCYSDVYERNQKPLQ